MCLDYFHFVFQVVLQFHWFWWYPGCASRQGRLQVACIEDWVKLMEPALQILLVGSGANALYDLERAYPARRQLVGAI